MSRKDLKEAGEQLDAGTADLVVVGVADMESKIERVMARAEKVEAKKIEADAASRGSPNAAASVQSTR
jgi:hypothetical protein